MQILTPQQFEVFVPLAVHPPASVFALIEFASAVEESRCRVAITGGVRQAAPNGDGSWLLTVKPARYRFV